MPCYTSNRNGSVLVHCLGCAFGGRTCFSVTGECIPTPHVLGNIFYFSCESTLFHAFASLYEVVEIDHITPCGHSFPHHCL
ncbi:hypothetical protein HanRHA438_Chr05g0213741 [Helianthus annuus]|nr:hypothetical protein HanRHA438_Chr05g0213741 [Helianthus annuus]